MPKQRKLSRRTTKSSQNHKSEENEISSETKLKTKPKDTGIKQQNYERKKQCQNKEGQVSSIK